MRNSDEKTLKTVPLLLLCYRPSCIYCFFLRRSHHDKSVGDIGARNVVGCFLITRRLPLSSPVPIDQSGLRKGQSYFDGGRCLHSYFFRLALKYVVEEGISYTQRRRKRVEEELV